MKFKSWLLASIAFIVVAACTTYRYEYIAPATESGKTCAMQCLNTKNICYSAMQAQTQNNVNYCQQQNHFNYQSCIGRAHSQDEAKKCNPNGTYCSTSVNYYQCDETYRQCFATCGGTVRIYKNE